MRFGTSKSPKRTRSSTAISAPAALRPWRYATPLLRSVLAPHHYRKWLDAMLGWLLCFPYAASRLRENSAPSSLLGTTGHRFALHGRQRMNSTALSGLALAGAMCIGNTPQAPPKRLDAVCCRVGKGAAKF